MSLNAYDIDANAFASKVMMVTGVDPLADFETGVVKTNDKKANRPGRATAPKRYTSLSTSALVMDLASVDDEFDQFVQQCLAEHYGEFSERMLEPGRKESRHRLPLGFPGPPVGDPHHIAEVVVLTDTAGHRTTTVVMLDIEHRRLEERDGEVRSFADLGDASDDGPTITISSV